ncbi:ABC transporter substrate-binding protein [Lacticaseibacillus baoqingensis]|uniref:ABC transporter substrate-binding protein n=1 Tax=Lacticaseibacillus baoqingensis TaxID=2486013 RepID=A0ABW4E925_9LACO|nr:MetQ/NlpA family ABC transporter substrate-binding protein [Lacticaseibacillus baoqingensis]
MKKHWVLGFGLAVLGSVLVACAPKESAVQSSGSAAAPKSATIRIGTMAAPDSLPLYVAQQAGYFKKHHLNVKLTAFKSPKERDAAIAGGQLDAAVSDAVALSTYVNGQLGFKSATALTGYFGIVTSADNVKSVADLKGQAIATMPRQTPTFYLDQQLAKAGLKDTDVAIKEVAAIPVRLQLVANKQAAATILPDPFLSMAKAQGLKVIAQSDPAQYQTTLLAVDRALGQNQAVMKRFYQAYDQAVKTINKHHASDYQALLTKQLGFPAKIAAAYQLPHYQAAQAVPTKTLKQAFAYAHQTGILKQAVDASDYQLQVQ